MLKCLQDPQLSVHHSKPYLVFCSPWCCIGSYFAGEEIWGGGCFPSFTKFTGLQSKPVWVAEPRRGVDILLYSVFNLTASSSPGFSAAVSMSLLCPAFRWVVATLPQSPTPLFALTVTFICT